MVDFLSGGHLASSLTVSMAATLSMTCVHVRAPQRIAAVKRNTRALVISSDIIARVHRSVYFSLLPSKPYPQPPPRLIRAVARTLAYRSASPRIRTNISRRSQTIRTYLPAVYRFVGKPKYRKPIVFSRIRLIRLFGKKIMY